MKKIAIVLLLASFASLVQAAPKDNTWCIGGKLGWSQFHDTGWYRGVLNNDGPTHENQLSTGVFGGYQVNPHVGFEMGFDWLGRVSYKGDSVNGAFKAQGVQLTGKLNYPIIDDLDAYTRLGGIVWHANSTNSFAGNNQITSVSPIFAGGIEWVISPEIATRLEYQWINNIGDVNTVGVRPDNGMLSVGFSYRFGQQETPIVVAPAPKVQTKHFSLKSDLAFNFNKVNLKANAQRTLDKLATQLINLNPKAGSVIVFGFSDRIGSDTYNQDLSEKRAKLVADYLISKNIPNIKISSRGMGESNSVTGNTCDNVKVRKTLINCLAPDRRVEIEIKGIKDTVAHPAT